VPTQTKICTRCVLPDTFPGISFNEGGECNYCQEAPSVASAQERFDSLRVKMSEAIEAKRVNARDYDCIVAYSGGKDSTFTLKLLQQVYGLRCLAVTVDNGFMSDQARKNCDVVTTALGVDYVVFKPASNFMNNMYLKSSENSEVHAKAAIKRASNICNSCINLINIHMIKLALQHGAPIVAGGYIGGQVPKDAAMMDIDLKLLIKTRQTMQSKYKESFGSDSDRYMQISPELLSTSQFQKILIVNPMLTVTLTEECIIEEIRQLGWEKPVDTGKNSSNCRLNDLGIAMHFNQYGFNPYVFELSEQIRNGLIDRASALEKASFIPDMKDLVPQARQIGLALN
jgi:hypothetical protein